MSPRTKASFTLVAALLTAAPAPTSLRAADDESDVAALSKKLRKLEEEVSALRRRLAELGRQPALRLTPADQAKQRSEGLASPVKHNLSWTALFYFLLQKLSLNLSLFVEGQNDPNIGQTPPFWLCMQ